MKKYSLIIILLLVFNLSSCNSQQEIQSSETTVSYVMPAESLALEVISDSIPEFTNESQIIGIYEDTIYFVNRDFQESVLLYIDEKLIDFADLPHNTTNIYNRCISGKYVFFSSYDNRGYYIDRFDTETNEYKNIIKSDKMIQDFSADSSGNICVCYDHYKSASDFEYDGATITLYDANGIEKKSKSIKKLGDGTEYTPYDIKLLDSGEILLSTLYNILLVDSDISKSVPLSNSCTFSKSEIIKYYENGNVLLSVPSDESGYRDIYIYHAEYDWREKMAKVNASYCYDAGESEYDFLIEKDKSDGGIYGLSFDNYEEEYISDSSDFITIFYVKNTKYKLIRSDVNTASMITYSMTSGKKNEDIIYKGDKIPDFRNISADGLITGILFSNSGDIHGEYICTNVNDKEIITLSNESQNYYGTSYIFAPNKKNILTTGQNSDSYSIFKSNGELYETINFNQIPKDFAISEDGRIFAYTETNNSKQGTGVFTEINSDNWGQSNKTLNINEIQTYPCIMNGNGGYDFFFVAHGGDIYGADFDKGEFILLFSLKNQKIIPSNSRIDNIYLFSEKKLILEINGKIYITN